MASKAQIKATAKFEAKTYDKILIRLRKDSDFNREFIKKHADEKGESLNEYITKAVMQRIERGE